MSAVERERRSIMLMPPSFRDKRGFPMLSFRTNQFMLLSVFEHSFLDGGDTHLLQESQVVLDMPVVGDATIPDLQQIGSNERNQPAVAPDCPERAREVSCEVHVHRDVGACHDHFM